MIEEAIRGEPPAKGFEFLGFGTFLSFPRFSWERNGWRSLLRTRGIKTARTSCIGACEVRLREKACYQAGLGNEREADLSSNNDAKMMPPMLNRHPHR